MKTHVVGRALLLAAISILVSGTACAQATRIWLSGVGDDSNPCSRTSPCKTFSGAMDSVAAGGEINVLDSAGYLPVTISKALTIDGAGVHASILASSTTGITVNAPGAVVILRNLAINGGPPSSPGVRGIRVVAVGELHIENVTIFGFAGNGIEIVNTSGASVIAINNVTLRNNTAGGILVQPAIAATAMVTLDRVTMQGNGRGLRAEDGSTVVVRDSKATNNDANGFVAISVGGRPVDLTLVNSMSVGNLAAGVYAGANARVKMSGMTVTRNLAGLQALDGGWLYSFGGNLVFDNTGFNGPASSAVPTL